MAWDKLDSNIINKNVIRQEQEPGEKQNSTPKVVPVVEENTSQTSDFEKPVEGYYIEKTSQEAVEKSYNKDDDDDDIDTTIDTDARITILPSIAINKTTNELTDAMEQSVKRAMTDTFQTSSDDSYFKAQNMIQDNRTYKCFDEINYTKNFNIYGKAIYEGNFQKYYDSSLGTKIELAQNSEQLNLGLNWKRKSDSTKIFAFGSYTRTDQTLSSNAQEKMTDEIDSSEELKLNSKSNSFSLFGAAQQRFNNGDMLTGGGFHINDEIHGINTTSFDTSYYYKKYMVLAEGKTTIYKVLNNSPVTKTDFSISLNPETANEKPTIESSSEDETNVNQDIKNISDPNTKKWSKSLSPFFDTQSIAGNTEEGLGLKVRLKRTDENSSIRIGAFGKASTTQQEDSNKYHVTFGSGIKYSKNIGTKSLLKAEAEIKDRYSFGNENIMTASANAIYTSPKFSAEAEAKKILISNDQPSYTAIVGRAYYTPTKNVNLYAEASYTKYKDTGYELKGNNVQAGVIVNF